MMTLKLPLYPYSGESEGSEESYSHTRFYITMIAIALLLAACGQPEETGATSESTKSHRVAYVGTLEDVATPIVPPNEIDTGLPDDAYMIEMPLVTYSDKDGERPVRFIFSGEAREWLNVDMFGLDGAFYDKAKLLEIIFGNISLDHCAVGEVPVRIDSGGIIIPDKNSPSNAVFTNINNIDTEVDDEKRYKAGDAIIVAEGGVLVIRTALLQHLLFIMTDSRVSDEVRQANLDLMYGELAKAVGLLCTDPSARVENSNMWLMGN